MIRDAAGNLYGTTNGGGASGNGAVFKIDTSGHERVLYSFTGGDDGSNPQADVIRDAAGNLYGTTNGGGASGKGVVFKVDKSGQETVLYSFTGGDDGSNPQCSLIRDESSNLYGTTNQGGTGGVGVVFMLDTAGQETVLHTFASLGDGRYPVAGVIRDTDGNLYGTTSWGGTGQQGVVYKVAASGQETVLHSFAGPVDGQEPTIGVVRDAAGNLYRTTVFGGTGGWGVVYKLAAAGHETVLHAFTGGADGAIPNSLILDEAGNLYGTAKRDRASIYTTLPSSAGSPIRQFIVDSVRIPIAFQPDKSDR